MGTTIPEYRTSANGAFLCCAAQNNNRRNIYTPQIILLARRELHPLAKVLKKKARQETGLRVHNEISVSDQ